jgi:phenylpyruvate tautomerase PptA (4-oxalocrotonate tautomerase family)
MGYRSENLAAYEREKIAERQRQEAEKRRIAKELQEAHNKALAAHRAEYDALMEKYQRKNSFWGWFSRGGTTRKAPKPFQRNWRVDLRGAWFMPTVMFVFFAIMIGRCVYHELYDLRDGYVTDKGYRPGYTTTECRDGSCTTHHHPPEWYLTVSFQGENAGWTVTEEEYNRTAWGSWYCARDLFFDAPCIRNQPQRR